MGCDIYYLDQFREAVAEEVVEKAAELEELKHESTAALKMLSERTAKLMLDLAFKKIFYMPDEAAKERLIRYTGELLRKANHDLTKKQDYEMTIKAYIEDKIEDK